MLLRRAVGVLRLLQLLLRRKRLLHHRSQGIQYIGVREHGQSTVNCRRGQTECALELKNEYMAQQMLTRLIYFIAADESWRRALLPKVLLIVLRMRVTAAPACRGIPI
jgi:hypothetical protein